MHRHETTGLNGLHFQTKYNMVFLFEQELGPIPEVVRSPWDSIGQLLYVDMCAGLARGLKHHSIQNLKNGKL